MAEEKDPKVAAARKQVSRSPAYPFLDLEEAIKKAGLVYSAEKRNPAPRHIIAAHWKYSLKSSGARLSISALKKYRLLEEVKVGGEENLKLTALALTILLEADAAKKAAAIKAAALSPRIFSELWSKYGDELPSDPTLKSFLLLDKEYNDEAANILIKNYKNTIAFAGVSASDKAPEQQQDDGGEDADTDSLLAELNGGPPPPAQKPPPAPTGGALREISFPVLGGNAVVRIPYPQTEESYSTFTQMLALCKAQIVKKDGE
jgi:hypothetical protein